MNKYFYYKYNIKSANYEKGILFNNRYYYNYDCV